MAGRDMPLMQYDLLPILYGTYTCRSYLVVGQVAAGCTQPPSNRPFNFCFSDTCELLAVGLPSKLVTWHNI